MVDSVSHQSSTMSFYKGGSMTSLFATGMTLLRVFMVWISMLCLNVLATESDAERGPSPA